LDQVKAALDASADNVTEAALRLGCYRRTLYNYLARYPELQEHRKDIVATMNDFAESTVKQRVQAREWAGTKTWLENNHPKYTRKQIIEHTGAVGVMPGMMTKDEILQLSDAELDKMDRALSLELATLQTEVVDVTVNNKMLQASKTGADDVRGDDERGATGASDRTGQAPETTD
jgi:hypothetical protein